MRSSVQTALAALGIVLLGINLLGFFLPLRSPDLHLLRTGDIHLTEAQFRERARRGNESNEAYAIRLTTVVHKGMASYGAEVERLHGQIPIHENYLLHLAGYLYPPLFNPYEFCNVEKAIARGLGICSQQCMIMTELLTANGVDARIVGLSGHIVVTAQVDSLEDIWWTFDPYYNKIIPHAIQEIESDPERVRTAYAGQPNADALIAIFGPEGNVRYRSAREYAGWKKCAIERLSYIAIWIIPIGLLSPLAISRLTRTPHTSFSPPERWRTPQ